MPPPEGNPPDPPPFAHFPAPSPMEMKGNKYENWTFFQAQFESYVTATGLDKKSAGVQVATLISLMGKECYQKAYKGLVLTEDDRKDSAKIIKALKEYFEPSRNVIYERYIFNTCDQGKLKIDEYVNKLRQLAITCDFGTLSDDLIRDRIVLGVTDHAIRARLLREDKLTLTRAMDMCRTSEITAAQLEKLNSSSSDQVNYTRGSGRPNRSYEKNSRPNFRSGPPQAPRQRPNTTATGMKCKYCGGEHERIKEKCPAYGQQCRKCKKQNHFSRVCRKKS
ncbi:uncharacterized protein [Amphiura filiformis]|uniref:uncharacterized protein n=1 Tax=Amphiura filiformis TaxID=82378 RepID=UPI003B21F986